MVAVQRIADRPLSSRATSPRSATARPTLRVIEGGAGKQAVRTSPSSVVAVAAVMATVMLVLLVRGVQGAPPAAEWNGLAEASSPASAATAPVAVSPGATFTVGPNDTWSSIAAAIAPEADPIEVARQLASANGGYSLVPGQALNVELQLQP